MIENMIISISGYPCSGKSTVAKVLAEKLGFNFYSMGDMRGKMAMDMGITLDELNKIGETDPLSDNKVDEYQKKLAETEDNFIIDGRLSFHFIPQSKKVYLHVDEMKAAKRLCKAHNESARPDEDKIYNIEEALAKNRQRVESDRKRYASHYDGLDCYDTSKYDYVIDTTNQTIDETVEEIINRLDLKLKD